MRLEENSTKTSKVAGFTLVELMVVLVLIAIMSAVMIPEMKGTYEDSLLRSVGRNFTSAISLAYSRSVTLNQVHRLRIDPEENTYYVESEVSSTGVSGVAPERRDFPGSKGEFSPRVSVNIRFTEQATEELPNTETSNSGSKFAQGSADDPGGWTIRFFPDGTAESKEVVLEDAEGFRIALRINPITARVRIVDLDRK